MDVREQGEEWCITTNTYNDSRHTQTFTESMKYLVDVSFWKLTWNITVVLAAVHNFFTGFYRFSSTFKVSKPNVSRLLTPLSSHLNCYYIPKAIIFQLFVFILIVSFTYDYLILQCQETTNKYDGGIVSLQIFKDIWLIWEIMQIKHQIVLKINHFSSIIFKFKHVSNLAWCAT